jgi:dolichyl-phosphate beta-glucosyltransferase
MGATDVTIIVPIYNEASTIEACIRNLQNFLEKTTLSIEVIVVESASTDGSHEICRRLSKDDFLNFRYIFEDSANGKGSACRLGLEASNGRCIVIFDADLEYNIFDLDLLAPIILRGENRIVLGSRHSSGPMRVFNQNPLRAFYYNFGHYLFTYFFNFLYGTKLKDPATMWKVFDGEIARKAKFRGDKFDFDWELLSYFVRIGFTPNEIPIVYKSRSPEEGKKIRPFADPLHWIYRLIYFRFKKL